MSKKLIESPGQLKQIGHDEQRIKKSPKKLPKKQSKRPMTVLEQIEDDARQAFAMRSQKPPQ